jgi:hypothetical protein
MQTGAARDKLLSDEILTRYFFACDTIAAYRTVINSTENSGAITTLKLVMWRSCSCCCCCSCWKRIVIKVNTQVAALGNDGINFGNMYPVWILRLKMAIGMAGVITGWR